MPSLLSGLPMRACVKREGICMELILEEKLLTGERLTWKLSDDIIVLCFYCHGRVLS